MTENTPRGREAERTALIVRFLRARRGWTQSELARQSGIYPKLISAYEQGTVVPTEAQLERLAASVGMPLSFVAGMARVALDLDQGVFAALEAPPTVEANPQEPEATGTAEANDWRATLVEDAARRAAAVMVVAFSALGSGRGDDPEADHRSDREQARILWGRLAPHPQEMRLLLADILPAARGPSAWALADLVCEKAAEALGSEAREEARDLAQLAATVVESAALPAPIRTSLERFMTRWSRADLARARQLLSEVAPNAAGN